MEESGEATLGSRCTNREEAPLLAFIYCDALVNTEQRNDKTIVRENVRLAYKEERNMILNMLHRLGLKLRFRSEPATKISVVDSLSSGCKILHFTGHGSAHSLEFENEELCGEAKSVKDGDLARLFSDRRILPELVLLSACRSEECGGVLANAGVPHVVAIRSGMEVPEKAAQDFCVPFYEALFTGMYTVKQAFDIATSTVRANSQDAAETFILLPTNGGNHDVKIFSDLPKGSFIDETPPLPPYFHLPAARRTYIGGIKIWKVLRMLEDSDTHCVTITGKPGIGKTETALQACHYMGERNEFQAIFFADCSDAAIHRQCSFPTSGSLQEHVQRLCQLVGEALDASPARNSPKDLWDFLEISAISKIGHPPFKVLLVLDAVNALIEGGGREARKSLADFMDQLCEISPHLKLLVTSHNDLQELTSQHLSNSTEQAYEVERLRGEESARLLLNLYPRHDKSDLVEEIKIERTATREQCVQAIQGHSLLRLVNGHPGVLCRISPLLLNRDLGDPEVKRSAIRYLEKVKERTRKMFSNKHANEISSQAGLQDRRCRDIWASAISWAADDGLGKGDSDNACYHHVPWSYLSLALQQGLCEIQTAFNDVGMSSSGEYYSWSESSSRSLSGLHRFHRSSFVSGLHKQSGGCGSDSSVCARELGKDELKFIRGLLKRSMSVDGNNVDGSEFGSDTWGPSNSTRYLREGGGWPTLDDQEEWFSLEAFARFSRKWMVPFIATLSKMQQDWAAIDPVRIHGFVSRDKAKRRLIKTGQPGVFMLRFSVSKPGRLIIDVTCKAAPNAHTGQTGGILEIQESLVTVSDGGRWTRHYDENINEGNTYESLAKLVYDNFSLQTLYPDIPKATAFSTA